MASPTISGGETTPPPSDGGGSTNPPGGSGGTNETPLPAQLTYSGITARARLDAQTSTVIAGAMLYELGLAYADRPLPTGQAPQPQAPAALERADVLTGLVHVAGMRALIISTRRSPKTAHARSRSIATRID